MTEEQSVDDGFGGKETAFRCEYCARWSRQGPLCGPCERLTTGLNNARELAAMYLQCLNSRALERGETVEQVAAFCEQEFAENPWIKEEYEKLTKREATARAFFRETDR